MASTPVEHLVRSRGIYHGLPDLSNAPNGLTAIVTGATGISGAHMVLYPKNQFSCTDTDQARADVDLDAGALARYVEMEQNLRPVPPASIR